MQKVLPSAKEIVNAVDFSKLIKIVLAADALEEYLGKNTGDNADWDVKIAANGPECANKLSGLLSDLSMALKPYRECKTPLDNIPPAADSPNAS